MLAQYGGGQVTPEQKRFILEDLSTAILREEGRGFAMSIWLRMHCQDEQRLSFDGVLRDIPSCGTVACIGGTILMITKNPEYYYCRELAMGTNYLGLTYEEVDGLFYRWSPDYSAWQYCWPQPFMEDFNVVSTTIEKAQIAVALLAEVVRTEGQCLHNPHYVGPLNNPPVMEADDIASATSESEHSCRKSQ
jgi:hypothetical protein